MLASIASGDGHSGDAHGGKGERGWDPRAGSQAIQRRRPFGARGRAAATPPAPMDGAVGAAGATRPGSHRTERQRPALQCHQCFGSHPHRRLVAGA